nr:MAG TPA: hypothetical protein [Caudoviricetes sp.]
MCKILLFAEAYLHPLSQGEYITKIRGVRNIKNYQIKEENIMISLNYSRLCHESG